MDIEDKIVLALREKLPKSCEKYRRFQELGHTGIWREFDNGTITLKEIEWYANALHTLKQYDDEHYHMRNIRIEERKKVV